MVEQSSKYAYTALPSNRSLILGASFVIALYFTSLYSYLLFHAIAEVFAISVSLCIFFITWNSQDYIKNGYLLFIGVSSLFVGAFDLLHTLAFKGMGIFPGYDANLPTQLWIASRYVESISLVLATFFFSRRPNLSFELAGFALVSGAVLLSIFYVGIFPDCFIEGQGLTQFKIGSEYIICFILLVALGLLIQNKGHFEPHIFRLLAGAILVTILTEITFTFYISVYGFSNLAGHFLKLLSYYLIYKAIIETGLRQPHSLLFRELDEEREKLHLEIERRENLEQALRKSEERYRVVADFAYDWEFWIDPESKFVYVSPSCERITGYSASEFLANAGLLGDIVYEDDRPVFQEHLSAVIKHVNHPPSSFDFRIRHRNGDIRWINHSCQAVTGNDGTYLGRRASNRDVTQTKKAEELVRQSDRHRAVADLSGGIAHNFNNLLQIVISGIENSISDMEDGDVEKAKQSLELILGSCDQGAETVRKLLHFASTRSETNSSDFKIWDLSDLVREAVEVSKPFWEDQAEREGIRIELNLDFQSGVYVKGNFNQLIDVIITLIRNAVEAIETSGVIEVRVEKDGDDGVVVVKDSGVGMSPADLNRLFTPFFTTKVTAGSGLALATGRKVIDGHGGKIVVESRVGQGTSFSIRLPLSKKMPRTQEDTVEAGLSKGIRILVVDDAKVVTDMLGAALNKEGYIVSTATSGTESIEKFRKEGFDAIVCDLGMPDMNGVELSRRIKAISDYRGAPKPPFIIITGWDQKLTPEFSVAGVDNILIKPVKVGRLLTSLDRLVRDYELKKVG